MRQTDLKFEDLTGTGAARAAKLGGRITSHSSHTTLSLLLESPPTGDPERILLRAPVSLIGRADECDITLVGETVSRVHCTIRRLVNGYVIEDRSRNGTWVNGHRVRESLLRDGDSIRVGPHQLQVELMTARATGLLPPRETGSGHLRPVSRALRRTPQLFVRGLEDGVTLSLTTRTITIGRRPGNDLLLEGGKVSRDHARIVRDGADFWLIDAGSVNGTFINGERIEKARLASGDQLRIGNYDGLVSFREEDCLLQFRKRTS